jgi:hypothetical protein
LWSTIWTAVGAGAAVFAALIGWRYLVWTRRMWEEAAKQRESSLMLLLMEGYDNLRDSIEGIRDWNMECWSSNIDPIERFKDELGPDYGNEQVWALDKNRFRVSRFFVKTRKLVEAGYLSEDIVRRALGGQAIEDVFLNLVDPLDKARAGQRYSATDRRFYTDLLQKYPRPTRPAK